MKKGNFGSLFSYPVVLSVKLFAEWTGVIPPAAGTAVTAADNGNDSQCDHCGQNDNYNNGCGVHSTIAQITYPKYATAHATTHWNRITHKAHRAPSSRRMLLMAATHGV